MSDVAGLFVARLGENAGLREAVGSPMNGRGEKCGGRLHGRWPASPPTGAQNSQVIEK
ncbi:MULTISPECIES: hypothetical protein [Chelatococcus]|uniref:Uncharacterized protein n=1 Tax=Chelatococcus caeni TaxID=1348468 RepID=A0A840BR85_9HYPH|nr:MULTISPECIES: hypothetical protein [Chelatococcus]MBB4015961.1 hypothetical protein [Chelatococcus caeni]